MRGFTLIELLVVISILAITSVASYLYIKDSATDQVTNKAVGQIQSLLRLTQSNATSAVLCNGTGGASWSLIFKSDQKSIDLVCGLTNLNQRTYTLENTIIDSIQCTGSSKLTLPVTLAYAPLSGTISISSAGSEDCLQTANSFTFNVKNIQTNSAKTLILSKGGAINVQ